ncbi:hypoxanthine phosphoribosyltransferase [Pontibacter ummariensis]|uniref:Hypoxanthine phosphoribosyltransferase n=1 Tax=Pontibacter ummariensis TaxID=1610492 RepID=A0A239GDG5_9BACT|nr:hypoxanthine phosphoribosyltransferase [Pontibacter ummariensis]PRY11564.1 hypoxanthine phosphoribosyltransferase [Pontibacter ummariensis]SNS66094.1 hypoxanthine phosphoribosyltransferase [Pontibacter ummariensis]
MDPRTVKLHDCEFSTYIFEEEIIARVNMLAEQINKEYEHKQPLFLAVLNGSFMFTADLMKRISIPCEISFIRLASYQDMQSTGKVKEILGLSEDIHSRHVVVLEDIVDTGHTVHGLLQQLKERKPASVEVATLLLKPDCLQHPLDVKYVARSIPNDFVVGYGLDYNGLGRNLRDIYKIIS